MPDYMPSSTARPHSAAASSRFAGLRLSTQCLLQSCLVLLVAATALTFSASARAQANTATAVRRADLQVGGYAVIVPAPDYTKTTFYGGGAYATLDFKRNFGVEVNFRQASIPNDLDLYERTYEVGGRYVRHYGRINPYGRVSYGRGVFNFIYDQANLAYNLVAFGGGADVNVMRHVNVRGDYEYQRWFGFPPNGLNPQVVSIGVAYHF